MAGVVLIVCVLSLVNVFLSVRVGIYIGEARGRRDFFKEWIKGSEHRTPQPSTSNHGPHVPIRRELPRE